MADAPLDFNNARRKKHGPDPDLVHRDTHGVEWFKFVCSYRDGEDEFAFELWATDHADAKRRMRLIARSGSVDGQLFHVLPISHAIPIGA